MKIELPESLLHKIGPEIKMDYHLLDVKLNDGTVLKKMILRGGRYITDSVKKYEVGFDKNDIIDIKPSSFWNRLFKAW